MLKKFFALALIVSVFAAVPAGTTSAIPYAIDKNHSTIGFSVPILGGISKVSGKFTDFDVKLVYDDADINRSSVSATIKTASIDTGIENRDKHLRTADFFDAEKYPEITFQSSRIEKKGNHLTAYGTFTMHGVSKEIALPFMITGKYKDPKDGDVSIGFSSKLMINRQDYGVSWRHKDTPTFVGDEVEIELNLITRATAQK
jgi:polyisoprenoid-binding protein YceI